ncbi:hypothetical protein [Dactylosporangium sp. CS-033363]|uniref:hypothetical protein n=1 Tax=Dactylosporangium sp. CS-033363 TaxID=3239935 RepID=UPI003D93AC21
MSITGGGYMGTSRAVLAGVAVCALLSTAACGKSDSPGAAPAGAGSTAAAAAGKTSAAPADARTELLDATAKTSGTTSSYTTEVISEGDKVSSGTGKIDPARHANSSKSEFFGQGAGSMEMVVIGTDLYLKMNMAFAGTAAGSWMHIDGQQAGSLTKLGINADDPANLSSLPAGLVSVEKTGPGSFKGILDLTRTPAGKATMQQLGDAAKQIDFRATVGDGHLVALMIIVPSAIQMPAYTTTLRYSDFGAPVTIAAPAGAKPAPPALLEALK